MGLGSASGTAENNYLAAVETAESNYLADLSMAKHDWWGQFHFECGS